MKKFSLLLLLTLPLAINAQLKVEPNGRVEIGELPSFSIDTENEARLMIFGKYGNYRAGGKITFGDFGNQTGGSWNAFVGEYTNTDTDQLWLHGKNGIYITKLRAYPASDIVAYYDPSVNARFVFNTNLRANGVDIASDSRYKENVKEMKSSLASLAKLKGVTYNLIPEKVVSKGATLTAEETSNIEIDNPAVITDGNDNETAETDNVGNQYLADKTAIDKAIQEKSEAIAAKERERIRYGFIAQELQKVFPDLVSEDQDGYLSVDYIGLIPVIVEALKEQGGIITAQSDKIKELENKLAAATGEEVTIARSAALPEARLSNESTTADAINETANAFLYQNAPNPFHSTTTIRYFLPNEAATAALYIFDLQGKLLNTYPIGGAGAGEGAIEISASGLQPGMYIYSLLVNNQEVDTKKMVITK